MIIVTLSELIAFIIIVAFIVLAVISIVIEYIINTYKEKSKKWNNCWNCKYYYLADVSSVGGYTTYSCEKDRDIRDGYEPNKGGLQYRKCTKFKKKD